VTTAPFQQKETIDKPGIIGARWWQESLATQVPRRSAITGLLALGGALAAAAAVGTCAIRAASGPSASDVNFEQRTALDMQKQYGWNFGAVGDPLVFDGTSTKPFDRSALGRIVTDLAPSDPRHARFYVPTLFQSVDAAPTAKLTDDPPPTSFVKIRDALSPVSTPSTDAAFKQGQALAAVLGKDPRGGDVAVIVDLPGPEAVAFAAGAAATLDPVFLFDNWPHPKGVVAAHQTLAVAAYYQPLFASASASRAKGARPMFVLDRNRLATYTDDSSQFDNRHTGRLPTTGALSDMGVKNLVYVPPNAVQRQELDDLVDDFLAYGTGHVAIRVVPASAFEASSDGTPDAGASPGTYYYGGSPTTDRTFWTHWTSGPSNLATNDLELYAPRPRQTPFSSGRPGNIPTRPAGFGTVPVAIAIGTGIILGAKMSRSGSWNRTSFWSSGS
jgi:hypothetical protein